MSNRATGRPSPEEGGGTVAHVLVWLLWHLGIRDAWGVCGREIVPVWSAFLATLGTAYAIATRHARHENGAGFAALGSWTQTDRPVAVFVTTGPGLTNALTSLETARAAGAKLVLISPLTPADERGRLGIQATGPGGYATPDLHAPGRLFDLVAAIETPEQLTTVAGRLASGLQGPGGFAAHIAIPTKLQAQPARVPLAVPAHRRTAPALTAAAADELTALLASAPFGVWVGWGARKHAAAVRRLLDRTGAPVVSSPRGLGIADVHPAFLGVTGNGGSASLPERVGALGLHRMLVLGTGLGEATSGWDVDLVPPGGLIHVDLDPSVFGHAYPAADTVGVQADVGAFLEAILERADRLPHRPPAWPRGGLELGAVRDVDGGGAADGDGDGDGVGVHPAALMAAIQRIVVDGTDMPVFADASSAMFWGARHLTFAEPGRWIVENRFGAMGSAGAAVVGAASGRGGPAAAICGDGALHMQDEINTAVRYGIRALWIVLNDGGLGIVRTGMEKAGWPAHDADYPETDFAAVARAKGAQALRVEHESDLDEALAAAVDASGPFVLDVVVDRRAAAPLGARAKR